nr:sugar porter family MFS transporter [Microbulbifer sp. NKW57]
MGFIILISCVATIGGFLFGFDSGVINGTVDGLRSAFQSDSIGTGFNVASMLLGCAAGAFFAGHLADLWGRRSLLMIAAALFVISAWGSGISTSSLEFVHYRILGGLAVGAASVMSPAYISEVAPAEYRGRLTTIQQVAIISGLFVAFISNYFIAGMAGSSVSELWLGYEAWRWMFWMEMIPATIFLVTLFMIPESPRFLVLAGKEAKAAQVLERLYGVEAEQKFAEIKASVGHMFSHPKLADMFNSHGRVRRIILVGIGLAVFQQLVGINVVFYYGAVLWQSVGFSESDALLINVLSGGLSIAACLLTIGLVDRIGRKPLLWAGSVAMTAMLAIMAFAFSTANVDAQGGMTLSDNMGTLALVAANAYVFAFNATWGPVMWVMLGEMFPNRIRGTGLAVAGLFQWGANFLITLTFPMLLGGIGLAGAYGIYALFALLSIFFVMKHVRETRGLELEQMQG